MPSPGGLSPALYQQIVDAAPSAMVLTDADGTIVLANRQIERLFGYRADELVGQNVDMLMPGRYREGHPAFRSKFLRQPQARLMGMGRDLWALRKDGSEFPVEVGLNPLDTPGGKLVLSAIVDLTERKHLESQLRAKVDELARDDQQKNEFLAMLGHELRNPLAPISNAVHLMTMPNVDAATIEQARALLQRQLQHLVRLVDDLLDVGRIVSGRITLQAATLDLNEAVRRGIEAAQPLVLANDHDLLLDLHPAPLWVSGDGVRLGQAVLNLLTNAARYTPKRGQIRVRTYADGPNACCAVDDDGIGIDSELLPQVFDLFVQGKSDMARSKGGLGVGLTLVQRIVRLHSGNVEARSAGPGRGATFVLQIPLLPAVAAGTAAVEGKASAESIARRRVLVVDDNVDAAESLASFLRLLGHTVETVYDGRSALAALRALDPEVIVLDIGLPDMSGFDVARSIRSRPDYGAVPIVAVTGYGQARDREQSRAAQIDLHLTKPVDLGTLQTFVAAA